MTWPGLQAVQPLELSASSPLEGPAAAREGAANGFGALVQAGLESVNGQLISSEVDLQRLATGEAQNLHQVMIRLEESRLSFQLLMQVRNRVLEAYQEVMRMQV